MALLLLFCWGCCSLLAVHRGHYGSVAKSFSVERFGRKLHGFFGSDLSAFCFAVSNVGEVDSHKVVLARPRCARSSVDGNPSKIRRSYKGKHWLMTTISIA